APVPGNGRDISEEKQSWHCPTRQTRSRWSWKKDQDTFSQKSVAVVVEAEEKSESRNDVVFASSKTTRPNRPHSIPSQQIVPVHSSPFHSATSIEEGTMK